jgi:hypothetical protein
VKTAAPFLCATLTYYDVVSYMVEMTPKQFNEALKKLRLSVYASAPVLGISLRQAQRYSNGEGGQVVSGPVANHLTVLVDMIEGWKVELKKVQEQIDFFEKRGGRIGANGRDTTKSWLAELHRRRDEWDDLLRDPGNGLPSQID